MSIELITHCYAERLPQYAALLRYQLSSLILHRPKVETFVTVCCAFSDKATSDVLDYFFDRGDLNLKRMPMSVEELGRRSIGRNRAALRSFADIVWFTDVDYVFGEYCIDTLDDTTLYSPWEEMLPDNTVMIYPGTLKISKNHEKGNEYIETNNSLPDIDAADFVPKHYARAIGGVQIVAGDFARTHGYLNCYEKWQTPRTDDKPFGDFRDDIAYRKFCQKYGDIVKIELPNLYRIRHKETTYK